MRHLNVANLEAARLIAQLGSFTAAAEKLNLTQPGISARVRELEGALGMQLFRRNARGVIVTVKGREFLRKADPLLRYLQELALDADSPNIVRGEVRIGITHFCTDWLPRLVKRMNQEMPSLTFAVEFHAVNTILGHLETGKIDLAITVGDIDAARFGFRPLNMDRLMWVMKPGLNEGYDDIRSFIRDTPIWCYRKDSRFRIETLDSIEDTGITDARINFADTSFLTMEMALHGVGIGLLWESVAKRHLDSGALCPVPGIDHLKPIRLNIAWPNGELFPVLSKIVDEAQRLSLEGKGEGRSVVS